MTHFRARLYACFALVYLVWGSSFLVARIGVVDLPPLLFTSLRSLIGGTLFSASRGTAVTGCLPRRTNGGRSSSSRWS